MATMETDINKVNTNTKTVPWWTSCRFVLAVVGLFGTTTIYMLRANMSLAIVCMTRESVENNNTAPGGANRNYTIPGGFYLNYIAHGGGVNTFVGGGLLKADTVQYGEFDWSKPLQGWILSSFYFGYLPTQMPGGWLSNKFGAKIIIGSGVLLLTLGTVVTPIAARSNVYLLMFVQALKGLASGVYYPAFYQLFGRWTTPGDRTVIIAIFSAGSSAGSVLSSILSGLLCDHGFDGGWPSIFYILGIIGAVWCVAWYFIGFSSPHDHPRISEAELDYIQTALSSKSDVKTLSVPWKDVLTTVPLYAITVVNMCFSWCWFVAITCLPQYMSDVLKFNIQENGFYNSLPYIANFFNTILVSMLGNHLLSKKVFPSLTFMRKLFQTLAMVPGAAMAIGVAFLTEKQTGLAVALLTIWVGLMGCSRCGAYPNAIDIAPRYSGITMGIGNMISTIPAIIAPIIIGVMTKNGSAEEWQRVFFLSAGIFLFGWLIYVIFSSAEEQEWAKVVQEQRSTTFENSGFVESAEDIHSMPTNVNRGNVVREGKDAYPM